jgi:hypothetical protein
MMDAGERELFAASVGQAVERHDGADLDAALDDLGWPDALVADPRVAVSALFERQGAANRRSSALDRVVAVALGLDPAPGVAVVLPPLGRTRPPGTVVGEGVRVGGLGTTGMARGDRAVVVSGSDGPPDRAGDEAVAAVVATRDLAVRAVRGLDPALGLVEVSGDHVRATSRPDPAPAAWPAAVAAGQRALAHELVGAAREALDLARAHALDRIQFGRPIAGFQAVRHRLAESLVAIEAADAALAAAWDEATPFAAALAKAIAGRSARTVARHGQQVLAGIGFTTEHPFHRHARRILVLDGLLGDARSLTGQLGADLLDRRALPAILPL